MQCSDVAAMWQVRRRKDPTIPQEGYVTVLWFTRCCKRHEGAEKVDRWLKYCSSVGVSLLLCILSFYICSLEVTCQPTHAWPSTASRCEHSRPLCHGSQAAMPLHVLFKPDAS
jgi:hypothetical protein